MKPLNLKTLTRSLPAHERAATRRRGQTLTCPRSKPTAPPAPKPEFFAGWGHGINPAPTNQSPS